MSHELEIKEKIASSTNDQLIAWYRQNREEEYNERQMDGSGDCGHLITEAFRPVYEAIYQAFKERGLVHDMETDTILPA